MQTIRDSIKNKAIANFALSFGFMHSILPGQLLLHGFSSTIGGLIYGTEYALTNHLRASTFSMQCQFWTSLLDLEK